MTEQTPEPATPQDAATEPAATEPAATSGPGGGGGRRKAVIGGLAAVLVLGGGLGAYAAYDRLSGGGAQPHDVLPASTQIYARLDLDPSAGQKIDLFRLLRKVPDLADEVGIKSSKQDLRQLVFREVVAPECDDVDYAKDVKPWLGDRIGIGANIEDESFLIAVQTKDEGASRAGIKKLFACADETYGIAYRDGYAILGEKQADVDQAVKASDKKSLGEDATFVKDFDALGNQGIASAWADLSAISDLPEVASALGAQTSELKSAGTAATTLRADGSAIELAVLGGATPKGKDKGTDQATALGSLPKDTVAALSVAGLGDQVDEGFDAFLQEGGSEVQGFIDEITQQSGFKLPDDLKTLFGDSLTLAVGAKNIETVPALGSPEDIAALDVALSLRSDRAAALELVQRLSSLASDGGFSLVASPTDDGAVLATNQGAADAIAAGDGSLGDSAAFKSVIPDGESTSGGFYLDIGTIVDRLLDASSADGFRQDLESVKGLRAVGTSSQEKDGRGLTTVRVSFR